MGVKKYNNLFDALLLRPCRHNLLHALSTDTGELKQFSGLVFNNSENIQTVGSNKHLCQMGADPFHHS